MERALAIRGNPFRLRRPPKITKEELLRLEETAREPFNQWYKLD